MRITFVLPTADLSGGSRVLSIYAGGLQRRGHQVTAVSVNHWRPTLKDRVRSLLRGRGWLRQQKRGPSHFDGLPLDLRLLKHSGPVTDADVPDADVVIGTWWETVRWVSGLAPAKGLKVHFVQGYDIYGGLAEDVHAVYRLPYPKIVISNWLRDLIQSKYGQTPVATIPNSVPTDQFFAPARGKQPVPTVGTIYAIDPNRATDLALKAYDLALKELPTLKLKTMGTVKVSDELPLPPGAEFTFHAREQQLRDIYSGCDAWLFTTRQEGFGLPILEAMACRTPVIGTPAGAAPELLPKGGGVLVPHDDPAAMARAIVTICTLPDAEWRKLSDAALATATGYTWEEAVDRFDKALQSIVKGGAG
jgi:glycosyltransferase involved in cell wall biosynthesis